ncbi:hypothetical protein C8R45DRAFT_1010083, partial [Mycena sanguinolenta]
MILRVTSQPGAHDRLRGLCSRSPASYLRLVLRSGFLWRSVSLLPRQDASIALPNLMRHPVDGDLHHLCPRYAFLPIPAYDARRMEGGCLSPFPLLLHVSSAPSSSLLSYAFPIPPPHLARLHPRDFSARVRGAGYWNGVGEGKGEGGERRQGVARRNGRR